MPSTRTRLRTVAKSSDNKPRHCERCATKLNRYAERGRKHCCACYWIVVVVNGQIGELLE